MTVTAPAPRAASGGLDGTEVVVAGLQRILVAPVGTDAPDDIDEEPGSDWTDLGYTTEDGIAFSFGLDTDDLMTSQSLDPVRKLTTGRPKTITASLRQFNEVTLVLAMGGGTWDDDKFTPAASSFIDERAVLVDFEDGAKKGRFVGYRTMVSEAVEFSLVNTEGLVFPLTFSVLAFEPVTFNWWANDELRGGGGGGSGPGVATPSLATVDPEEGEPGDTVALTGTNFATNMTVHFGATAATNVVRTSATAATCSVPSGTGTVDVTVTNPGAANSSTLTDAFTYS